MSISTIKQAIKTHLDQLVTDGVIAGSASMDIKKSPLSADIPVFPYAYLMPPSVASESLDNRSNLRTYTFSILFIQNAENITTTDEIETMIEDVMDEFDNDPTLGGTARGGILPVSSAPVPLQHNGKDMITFVVALEAKADVDLTFS